MSRFRSYLVVFAVFCLASCSKLQYLDQALAVKAYSDEQDSIGRQVDRQDAQFERLVAAVRSGQAQVSIRTASELARQFGPPVIKEAGSVKGSSQWLYRYQLMRQGAKIYVAVAPDGRIDGFKLQE